MKTIIIKKYIAILVSIFGYIYCYGQNVTTTNLGSLSGTGGLGNVFIGYFSGSSTVNSGNRNTLVGYSSGGLITTGMDNTFLGASTGINITTGRKNVFIGSGSGLATRNLSNLTFVGTDTGRSNTTGDYNTFIGFETGYSNTTASYNTFLGYHTGRANTIGGQNTFIGTRSGLNNTTGSYNSFLGDGAGLVNSSGARNTFIGYLAGRSNTIASYNTFIGYFSGLQNTTGISNNFSGSQAGRSNTEGSYNAFFGANAGYKNEIGSRNTFNGFFSGYSNTKGGNNSFYGFHAGRSNTEGSGNTFIGIGAGGTNTTGKNNVCIGGYAGSGITDANNKLYIHQFRVNATPLILGDFETGNIAIGSTALNNNYRLFVNGDAFATGVWLSSDKRFKKDRENISNALETLTEIEGVTYLFKQNKKSIKEGIELPTGRQYGVIAQELEAVLPDLVRESKDGYKAVNYQGLIPVLIEALKELNANKKSLEDRIETLESKLEKLTQTENSNIKPEPSELLRKVKLYQNTPNPFDNATSIAYELPLEITNASIHVFDMQGTQKKVFENLRGKQQITIISGELPSGMYMYSLIVNGRIIDTKKMLLIN